VLIEFLRSTTVVACFRPDRRLNINSPSTKLIAWSNRKGHWAFEAVEALCKGLEISLP
jgi:hypothetical protein